MRKLRVRKAGWTRKGWSLGIGLTVHSPSFTLGVCWGKFVPINPGWEHFIILVDSTIEAPSGFTHL
jgi:hypothetical protein